MLNIISKANPTVEVTVTTSNAVMEHKTISLNQSEAEELFVNMQVKSSDEWQDLDCVVNIIDRLDTDLYDDEYNYNVEIKFDDSYIEYMNRKYPSREYDDYFEDTTVYRNPNYYEI